MTRGRLHPIPEFGSAVAGESRVLAIDHSRIIHRLLRSRLKRERLAILSAYDADEGLTLASTESPDVILLGAELAEADGFEVLRQLKGAAVTRDIPVIFLSTDHTTEDKVRAFEIGAIDFVTKPFDIAELRARIRSAIRISRLIRMLAQRAQLDGLTGLWNREHFNERLKSEVAQARRHGQNLALTMCDLDRFKSINDRFGHPFGDRVLEEFANLLGACRQHDICCRYGGEEFALILPQTEASDAADMIDRLRIRLAKTCWTEHPGLVVTASFGVADLHRVSAATNIELLLAADQALYQAKRLGRNRVELAPLGGESALRIA